MEKHGFRFAVVILLAILAIVSFYMFSIHVPYYRYYNGLDKIRNEICETNHYEYRDYFSEYRGKEVYYIAKVRTNGFDAYVAYNKDKELVNTFWGEAASEESVKKAILDQYDIQVDQLEVGYENNKFVYYLKYRDEKTLLYIYYDLGSGEFMKAVRLGD